MSTVLDNVLRMLHWPWDIQLLNKPIELKLLPSLRLEELLSLFLPVSNSRTLRIKI
jgi:hypothetical protein